MGKSIVKLGGSYLEWSSVVDAPVTYGLPLEDFKDYYLHEYGENGLRELGPRLARVEEHGTSEHGCFLVDDTVWLNRAGPGERPLSKPELVKWFCVERRSPTWAEVEAGRVGLPKCAPCTFAQGMRCPCWGTGVRP